MARFIGVDLAWAVDKRHTGIAVLDGEATGARLIQVSDSLMSLRAVTEFISEHADRNTVVAVDASLIVKNQTGQRPCETAIGREFGRYHASCHSTNRSKEHFDSGGRLVKTLERIGFQHGVPLDSTGMRSGRAVIEVYPHPAMIRLFRLDRIIQYKKGSVPQKRKGLMVLQSKISALTKGTCGLKNNALLTRLVGRSLETVNGGALKEYEDQLDAIFCGFLAWYYWRWGASRNEVFGDLNSGYIVLPKAPAPR